MSKRSEYVLSEDASVETETERPVRPDGSDDRPSELADVDPSLEEVLQVVFDIGVGERETYVALTAHESTSAGELAEQLDRDRSNVNRYLNNLFQKGLVTRRRRILQSGGHIYQYSARSPEEVGSLLRAGLGEWARTASNHIDEFVADTPQAHTESADSPESVHDGEEVTCRVERR